MRSLILQQHEVRALLDRGTVRVVRPVKPQPTYSDGLWEFAWGAGCSLSYLPIMPGHKTESASPFGAPGSRLWVREAHALNVPGCGWQDGVSYRADHSDPKGDGPANPMRWRASTQMPRWASRLTVETEAVRCMQVQDISEDDARAAGMPPHEPSPPPFAPGDLAMRPIPWFSRAWDARYAKRFPWSANPWVWAGDVGRVDEQPGGQGDE